MSNGSCQKDHGRQLSNEGQLAAGERMLDDRLLSVEELSDDSCQGKSDGC